MATLEASASAGAAHRGVLRTAAVPAAIGLVTAGVVISHYVALDSVPPGLFVDEAGISYAAQGIALDGHDEHGAAWPLYFQAFGEWKNPVLIYVVAAVFRVTGPGVVAARAVPTTFALLTAVLLGALAWRLTSSRGLGWATFAVAAVTPWLFSTGRLVYEVAALPALLAGFLLAWQHASASSDWRWGVPAGWALGLAAYSYSTARLFVPLLLLAIAISELSLRRWRLVVVITATTVTLMVPIALFAQAHPAALLARYQTLSVFNGSQSWAESAGRVWRVYTSAYSPSFLFLSSTWTAGGELFFGFAPALAAGLVALWRRRSDPFARFIALGLLLAPVPAALTQDFSHDLRNVEAVPFYITIAALGVAELLPLLTRERGVAVAMGALIAFQGVWFMSDYFSRVPDRMAGWQEEGLAQAVHDTRMAAGGAPVVVSDRIFGGDFLYAFYSGEDVRTYRARGLAGAGATYRPLDLSQPAPGSVVLTTAGEELPGSVKLEEVSITHTDDWGRSRSEAVFRIWRTPG
jgi:hypothetical protein